jgi:hypothetical protein
MPSLKQLPRLPRGGIKMKAIRSGHTGERGDRGPSNLPNFAAGGDFVSGVSSTEKRRAGLKPEHKMVLTALQVANLKLGRVATVSEVCDAMLPKEAERIKKTYAKDFGMAVSSILSMLMARELVFTPGRLGKNRYYGASDILAPEKSSLPDATSRRRRVLGLVYRAVEHFGRCVRVGDVIEVASSLSEGKDLNAPLITRDIMGLAETGELRVVGSIRGDEKGSNLYLPSDLDPETYKPTEPLTWLEEVAQVFETLWTEELERATEEGRRPRPVSTAEVRTRLSASHKPHPNLDDPRLLPNALIQLAQTDDPKVRKVERHTMASTMWAPVDVKDGALDLGSAFASDAERVAIAVERACNRLGRPVCVRDIKDEVELDPALQPAGKLKLRNIIADISKERIDGGDGDRRARVNRRCFYMDKVGGDAYYCHDATSLDEARSYVRFRQIELRWCRSNILADAGDYERCGLASVAIGQSLMVRTEAKSIVEDLDKLAREHSADGTTRREAASVREMASSVVDLADAWLARSSPRDLGLPEDVSPAIPGLTGTELLQLFKPIYPAAQDIQTGNKLTTFVSTKIRRFPNPSFESRFSPDSRTAAEYLYDESDALFFAASRWGGRECSLHAMMARAELGWLRDSRFVYPAARSTVFEERVKAVACLAFLWSDEGVALLRDLALGDPEPGVRQSALWAYGFARGEGAEDLLRERVGRDSDSRTRTFFMDMLERLESNDGLWWKV